MSSPEPATPRLKPSPVRDGMPLGQLVRAAGTCALVFRPGTTIRLGSKVMTVASARAVQQGPDHGKPTVLVSFARPSTSPQPEHEWKRHEWALVSSNFARNGLVFVPVEPHNPMLVAGAETPPVDQALVTPPVHNDSVEVPVNSQRSAALGVAWDMLPTRVRAMFAARESMRALLAPRPGVAINTAVWLLGHEAVERLLLHVPGVGVRTPGATGLVACGAVFVPETAGYPRRLGLVVRTAEEPRDHRRLTLTYDAGMCHMASAQQREIVPFEQPEGGARPVATEQECAALSPLSDLSLTVLPVPIESLFILPLLPPTAASTDAGHRVLYCPRMQGHKRAAKALWAALSQDATTPLAVAAMRDVSTGEDLREKMARLASEHLRHPVPGMLVWQELGAFHMLALARSEGATESTSLKDTVMLSLRGYLRVSLPHSTVRERQKANELIAAVQHK